MIKGGCYPPLNREHEYHTYSCLVNTWVVIDATYGACSVASKDRLLATTDLQTKGLMLASASTPRMRLFHWQESPGLSAPGKG